MSAKTLPAIRPLAVSSIIGLILMSVFTLIWVSNLMSSFPLNLLGAVFGVFIGYFASRIVFLIQNIKSFPDELSDRDQKYKKRSGMLFGIIFSLEGILIGITVTLLSNNGLNDYILPAIATIVGLHFYPMPFIFRRKVDYLFATWLTLAGVIGILAIADGVNAHNVYLGVALAGAITTTGYGVYMSRYANQLVAAVR